MYTDASFETEEKVGGIGALLVDYQGNCIEWFGFRLSPDDCKVFGSTAKETIIYELELAAAVLALSFWEEPLASSLVTWFGDNDSVRFALIRAAASGKCAQALMCYHLNSEVNLNMNTWFARVPTEANLSDFPSRLCPHPLLVENAEKTMAARRSFNGLMQFVAQIEEQPEFKWGNRARVAPSEKRVR